VLSIALLRSSATAQQTLWRGGGVCATELLYRGESERLRICWRRARRRNSDGCSFDEIAMKAGRRAYGHKHRRRSISRKYLCGAQWYDIDQLIINQPKTVRKAYNNKSVK